jgi:hypothetical protein
LRVSSICWLGIGRFSQGGRRRRPPAGSELISLAAVTTGNDVKPRIA